MKVKELIEELKKFDQDAKFLVSSDEELNVLFEGFEVAVLGDDDDTIKEVVIYGLSGKEVEQDPF
jgi:predicted glycosyltransferase